MSQIESLQTRLWELKQRVRLSDCRTVTTEALTDLKAAVEEMALVEEQLVGQTRELAAARQHAEAERERYQELFEFAPDSYLVTDRRGMILDANEAAATLFGVPKNSFLDKPLGFYVAHEDFKSFLAEAAAARKGQRSDFATHLRRQRGDTLDVLVTVTMADDNCVRWLIRDVTERKRAEERARSSERLSTMGATASLLAQEISNPLNDIFTTVQQLGLVSASDKKLLEDRLGSTLRELTQEIGHLRGLMQKFCSFAQPSNLNFDSVDVGRMIAELLKRESDHYEGRGILAENLVSQVLVKADSERLKRALANLCKNAMEAMPHGGKLTVRSFTRGDCVHLDIVDTGVGVPAEMDIFDLFTTTKFQAMGMGLPIAQQIITDHGGKISYNSAPGKTLFRVELPIAPQSSKNK